MNLGAFGVLALLGRDREERVRISDLAGLGSRQPLIAAAMTLFMLSLGGIPPTRDSWARSTSSASPWTPGSSRWSWSAS
jgi:NADH-quinone oxidoreductase subunit N